MYCEGMYQCTSIVRTLTSNCYMDRQVVIVDLLYPNYLCYLLVWVLQGRSQDFRKEGARLHAKRAKNFRSEATPTN